MQDYDIITEPTAQISWTDRDVEIITDALCAYPAKVGHTEIKWDRHLDGEQTRTYTLGELIGISAAISKDALRYDGEQRDEMQDLADEIDDVIREMRE